MVFLWSTDAALQQSFEYPLTYNLQLPLVGSAGHLLWGEWGECGACPSAPSSTAWCTAYVGKAGMLSFYCLYKFIKIIATNFHSSIV